jgi:glutaredoxin
LTLLAGGGVLIVAAAVVIRLVVGLPAVEAEQVPAEAADARARSSGRAEPFDESVGRAIEPGAATRSVASPAPAPVTASPSPVAIDAGSPGKAAGASSTPPSNAAIQAAFKQTRIVMFATSWCGVCTRARSFLDANGLTREEHDVEHDQRARAELQRLTGKGSVPVFLVDGELVRGFSEESMTRVLVASVERRLGVKGIRVRTAEAP